MEQKNKHRAALYLRLSRDDGAGESASIDSQRKLLLQYAKKNGFSVFDEYVDDGWSGTNFDRPAFLRMIAHIEAGLIQTVITKDLSRLGRDYITAGQYTELYFPKKGVRFIAVNDGYDSADPRMDLAPFQNVINELYARDISKKIRSAFAARMENGEFIGAFAPFGYRKDPEDRHHLLVDDWAGAVVQSIFSLAGAGRGPKQIAGILNERQIPPPSVYRMQGADGEGAFPKGGAFWRAGTVAKILKNPVYLGHTAQGKTSRISFKQKAVKNHPKEDWILVKDTHRALVAEEDFALAQRRMGERTCKRTGAFSNLFSGLAFCADCQRPMSATGTRKKGSPANLVCGGYKQLGKEACTNHFLDYNALYRMVYTALLEQFARIDPSAREGIVDHVFGTMKKKIEKKGIKNPVRTLQKDLSDLDRLVERLYGDYTEGYLDEDQLKALLKKYQIQRQKIKNEIANAKRFHQRGEDAWAKALKQRLSSHLAEILDPRELTGELLFRFICRIDVHQGCMAKEAGGRVKHQRVEIRYSFFAEKKERKVLL